MFVCKVTADAIADPEAMNEFLYSDDKAESKHQKTIYGFTDIRVKLIRKLQLPSIFISMAGRCATKVNASTRSASKTRRLLRRVLSATEVQQTSVTELLLGIHVDGFKQLHNDFLLICAWKTIHWCKLNTKLYFKIVLNVSL